MSRKPICTKSTKEVSQIVNKTCRACSLYFEESNLLSLWKEVKGMTKENDQFFIIDELKLINVGIEEDNELPQKICKTCVNFVQSVHGFRLLVKDSQILLKKQFCHKQNVETNNVKIRDQPEKQGKENISPLFELNFIDVSNTKLEEDDDNFEMSTGDDDNNFNSFDKYDENSNGSINDNGNRFGCWYCEKSFASVDERQKHEKDHKEEKPTRCETCKKSFKSLYGHKVHLRTHEELPYTNKVCHRCGEVLKNNDRLYEHLRKHRYNRIIKLPKSTKKTPTDSVDDKKNKEYNYKCPLCDKKYYIAQGLQKHMKLHDKSRKYRCNICNLGYTRNDHLLRHMNESHLKTKKYECTICDKVFLLDETRQRHLKHHVKKSYKCEICGKQFRNEEYKKVHIRVIHMGCKPYICAVCDERFTNKRSLEIHQSNHSKEQHQYANEVIVAKALLNETTDSIKLE